MLDPQHARIVVEHLVSVYYNSMNQDMGDQTECPIDWEQLGRQLLTTSGPDLTMQLLREAAKNLKPGTFSRGCVVTRHILPSFNTYLTGFLQNLLWRALQLLCSMEDLFNSRFLIDKIYNKLRLNLCQAQV